MQNRMESQDAVMAANAAEDTEERANRVNCFEKLETLAAEIRNDPAKADMAEALRDTIERDSRIYK